MWIKHLKKLLVNLYSKFIHLLSYTMMLKKRDQPSVQMKTLKETRTGFSLSEFISEPLEFLQFLFWATFTIYVQPLLYNVEITPSSQRIVGPVQFSSYFYSMRFSSSPDPTWSYRSHSLLPWAGWWSTFCAVCLCVCSEAAFHWYHHIISWSKTKLGALVTHYLHKFCSCAWACFWVFSTLED